MALLAAGAAPFVQPAVESVFASWGARALSGSSAAAGRPVAAAPPQIAVGRAFRPPGDPAQAIWLETGALAGVLGLTLGGQTLVRRRRDRAHLYVPAII